MQARLLLLFCCFGFFLVISENTFQIIWLWQWWGREEGQVWLSMFVFKLEFLIQYIKITKFRSRSRSVQWRGIMIVLINCVGTLPMETYWSRLLETDQFGYGTPEVRLFIINVHLNNLPFWYFLSNRPKILDKLSAEPRVYFGIPFTRGTVNLDYPPPFTVGAEETKSFDFDNARSLGKAYSVKELHRKLFLLTEKY